MIESNEYECELGYTTEESYYLIVWNDPNIIQIRNRGQLTMLLPELDMGEDVDKVLKTLDEGNVFELFYLTITKIIEAWGKEE